MLPLNFEAQILPFSLSLLFVPWNSWHVSFQSLTWLNPKYTSAPLRSASSFFTSQHASLQSLPMQNIWTLSATPHRVILQNKPSPPVPLLRSSFPSTAHPFPYPFLVSALTSASISSLSTLPRTSHTHQWRTRSPTFCHLRTHIPPA